MEDTPSHSNSKFSKMMRSVWFWILFSLVLLVVLFFSLLPIGIDYGIEGYLKNQGAHEATLEDVDFNPLTGRMTVTNLIVTISAETVLKFSEATFKIMWGPLVRKRFVLDRFTISDTQITVEELEGGRWYIGGIRLPDENENSDPTSWHFSFQEATVNNSRIRFISSGLKTDLEIEHAVLSKLTSWMPERRARLELTGNLNDGRLQLQLDAAPFADEIVAAGKIQLKGLSIEPFAAIFKPQLKTLAGRLDADLDIETRLGADSGLGHHQKGSVNLKQVRMQSQDADFSNSDLTWDGALRIDIPKSGEALNISADGKLNAPGLTMAINGAGVQLQPADFNWQGKINYAQDKSSQNLSADGQINLVDFKMKSPEVNFAEDKLTWQGALQISMAPEAKRQRITADGMLVGSHLLASLFGQKLKFEHQGLSWKGRLDTGEANDFNSLSTKAEIALKNVEIHHPETNQRLLSSNRIELKAIQVDGLNAVNVSGVTVDGLALMAPAGAGKSPSAALPVLELQQADLKDLKLSQLKALDIDAIGLKTVKILLHRNPEGKWPAIDKWNAVQNDVFSSNQRQLSAKDQKTASDTAAGKKSSEFGFRIRQIDISGDSGLQFNDESVSPAIGIDLKLAEASLTDLDSSRPQQPATLKLRISDRKQARLSLDGTMQPFAERLNLDWVGKIQSLELPPLSPYVIQNTGYRFVSGEMDADIPLKINQNQLNGTIDLRLHNPRAKAEKITKATAGKGQKSIPLDSALALLSDAQNNVKLKIPISGDISDPKFSVADAVNRVLVKTLQTATLSSLKLALGPYSIGVFVVEQAVKGAPSIRLNPIQFTPGSIELDETAIDYLQRVAAILKEHRAVKLNVCGVATENDRAAMLESSPSETATQSSASATNDNALLALAENRSSRVVQHLINRHGISDKRLIACQAQLDKDASTSPHVDLGI